jgi:hypothetical protein
MRWRRVSKRQRAAEWHHGLRSIKRTLREPLAWTNETQEITRVKTMTWKRKTKKTRPERKKAAKKSNCKIKRIYYRSGKLSLSLWAYLPPCSCLFWIKRCKEECCNHSGPKAYRMDTSVSTALPELGRVFRRADIVSWVGTSYLLTSTAFQPIYSRLSDIFGRKVILLVALAIFFVGSLACALANSMIQLIVFRESHR